LTEFLLQSVHAPSEEAPSALECAAALHASLGIEAVAIHQRIDLVDNLRFTANREQKHLLFSCEYCRMGQI
jgi:hypothetical protein